MGLIAAFLVAVYPNIWMTDELALSETIAPMLVAGRALLHLPVLEATRPCHGPSGWAPRMGVAMLGRDELTLLVVFIMVPLVLLAKALTWRRRFATLGVGLLAVALVVAPWVGYNLSRFDKPVFISSGLGVTLASADCAATYSGQYEGYWSMPCALHYASEPSVDIHADESVEGAQLQHLALDYVRAHENRLVPVTLAKLGRAFGFFHPMQQIHLDSYVETRPYRWAVTGLVSVLRAAGPLHRGHGGPPPPPDPLLPACGPSGLDVVFSVILTFGQTRYRTTFEVSLVLLAAVQLEWFWSRLRGGHDPGSDQAQEPAPDPSPPTPSNSRSRAASGDRTGRPTGRTGRDHVGRRDPDAQRTEDARGAPGPQRGAVGRDRGQGGADRGAPVHGAGGRRRIGRRDGGRGPRGRSRGDLQPVQSRGGGRHAGGVPGGPVPRVRRARPGGRRRAARRPGHRGAGGGSSTTSPDPRS